MLTANERERYDRQIMIPEITEAGQEKLKAARVMIAGAGGLGSPIALYLAAAGIGRLRLVDHDQVTLSNLNRQVLHWSDDVGRKKVDSAGEKLRCLNPDIIVESIHATVAESTIDGMLQDIDVLVDAMDNIPSRFVLNKAAIDHRIPFVHGAVAGFEGRAMTVLPGKTACLRCITRGPVQPETYPVIGVAPAMIGVIEATEVIKYLLNLGGLLTNCMLRYDGMTNDFLKLTVKRNPQCEDCAQVYGKE
ncbi:MAG TPA: HesA/MoeB/ThiF family protein [Thermodesulfobacteriota bacterium]|nr:HesA/MoeB/ThiF family protein [Deltaproteobacteria bacterium]HNR11992.1 HesA/MoeB/ThiF family protein [Thermodesulfobacteriota bacterium]